MASKRNMDTKYSFKGTSKIDNKYANIFQDLNEKQEVIKTNSLSKMKGESDEIKDDLSIEKKYSIREISKDEAEENVLKRKQAVKNEQIIATQKSSPVISHRQSPELDRIESLERLKREKRALKKEVVSVSDHSIDDNIALGEDAPKVDEDTIVLNNVEDLLYSDRWDNNPKSIRELAKAHANMDKSNVEIYKEYSDFDRSYSKHKDGEVLDNSLDKNYEDEIKKRENEIEELIRLMRKDSKGSRGRVAAKAAQKNNKSESGFSLFNKSSDKNSNYRANVYINNSKKNEPKINFKRLAFIIIVGLVLILFIAAGIDKLLSDRNNSTVTTGKTTTTKTTEKNETKAVESKDEKIKKLESIRGKLNVDENERLDYVIDNIDTYPDEFINLLIRNYETVDYVYSYKDKDKYNQKQLSTNISSSYYVDGKVPLFLQWDRRWGYRTYGKEYIGLTGCGPTSLAMVIRHFDSGSGINPYDVAKYSQENGYVSKDNYTSWSLFEKGLSNYGLESSDVVPVEATMKKALDDGKVIIASVKPGIFTERGHIIVIKGYNRDGDFLINDPNSIVNTNKTWSFDELKNEIRKLWGVSRVGGAESSSSSDNSEDTSSSNSESDSSSGNSDDPSIIQDIN